MWMPAGEGRERPALDVTGTINLRDSGAYAAALDELLDGPLQRRDRRLVATALADVIELYAGRYPGYGACHTPYHDLHHALDVALAQARMLAGMRSARAPAQLTSRQAAVGVVCALFHDAGYIRRLADRHVRHGARYTAVHVRRSARFVAAYLASLGLGEWVPAARCIVGHTLHRYPVRRFGPGWARRCGEVLASADLLAQLADPYYLEKCRYRLHPEFVIAGILPAEPGCANSVQGLLRETPRFVQDAVRALDGPLGGMHRWIAAHFAGTHPYLEAITANLTRIETMIARDDFNALQPGQLPPPAWGALVEGSE